MPQPITALDQHTLVEPLPREDARALAAALERARGGRKEDGFLLGGSPLPADAEQAVLDLLGRLADGDGVELASAQAWLSTSQAARAAGISQSYVRQLADAGELPVVFRGTHRRFRATDVRAWVSARSRSDPDA